MRKNKDKMVGLFFHTFDDKGELDRQGHIDFSPSKDMYMVTYFCWVLGEPYNTTLVSLEDMKGWYFYQSAKEMQSSYDHGPGYSRRSQVSKEVFYRQCIDEQAKDFGDIKKDGE